MRFFGQNPNAWYGNGPLITEHPWRISSIETPPPMTLGQLVGNHHTLIDISQPDKSAMECLTGLWVSHLTSPASAVVKGGNLTKNWPWVEPDDDPEFIAFMAKYGIEIPVRTLEQRLIPMEDA